MKFKHVFKSVKNVSRSTHDTQLFIVTHGHHKVSIHLHFSP